VIPVFEVGDPSCPEAAELAWFFLLPAEEDVSFGQTAASDRTARLRSGQ